MDHFLLLVGKDQEFTAAQAQAAADASGGHILDRDNYFIGRLSRDGTLTNSMIAQAIIAMRYQATHRGLGEITQLGPIADRDAFKAARIALLDSGAEHVATEETVGGYVWHYRPMVDIPNPEPPEAFVARHIREKVLTDMIAPLMLSYQMRPMKRAMEDQQRQVAAIESAAKAEIEQMAADGEVL